MDKSKSIIHIAKVNDDIKSIIPESKISAVSQGQNEDSPVETSEESCQARARSGNPHNGDPTIPFLLEGQGCLSAERSIGCNQGSASTTGMLGKEGNVKPTRKAVLPSLCKRKCSWGLIWRKKKLDLNTWEDFISRKVILNGNPDMHPINPTCHYCSEPYDSSLMYIQCETCPRWYHADAVGLEEKKMSDLVGFKCCKCRKIRQPPCPHAAPEIKRIPDVKKLKVNASKLETISVGPCPASVQEQQDLLPNSADDTPHAAHDDPVPVPVSSSKVQPQSENKTLMDYKLNTGNDSAAQKLPIRRSANHEKDVNLITGDGLG